MKEVSVGLDGDRCIGLISNAPKNVREALEYWTAQLRQVPPSSDPEEFALCHLKLGQVFHAMGLSGLEVKSVVKSVESSLHHFNLALRVYSPSNHPVRWAIAALDMGQAFGSMARLLDTEVAYEESGIETMEDDVDNTPSSEAVAKWRKDTSAKAHKATEYWQKAFDNIEQSITCLDVRSAPRTRARAFTELSKIHLRLKGTTNSAERRDLAIHALEEALSAHDAAEVSPGTHEPHDYAYHLHVGESEETDDEERDRIACGSACMQLANLCVQTHECTLGGSMESLANAIRHLERALPQLEHSKRDWCEASRLLARTQLELSHSKGPKAISKCIQALQDVLAQAPASATLLVHELNWSLGRLQLRQLQLTNAKLTTWESNQEAISIIEGRLRTAIKSLDQGNAESVTASPKILRVREVTIRRELGKLRLLSGLLAPSGDVKAVEFERASALFHSCIQQAPWGSSTMAPSEWLEGNGMIAECLCRMGRFKEAQRIYDQIADRAGALVNQLPYASVDVNPGIVVPAGVTADYPSVYESALRQHLALNWVSMWLWCQTGIECHRHSGLRSSPPTEGGEWRWISNDDTLEDPGATYATPGTPASKSKAGGNNNAAAVPLAPKGVAAPSAPAPEWVVQMQTHWALGWEWRSVEGRAVPFLLELGPPTELIGHPAALGVLRLVCRAGQLLAIEQLLTHGDSLRVRHMINKLDKETRRQLLDRRAKVRDDLMNVRKREAQGPALLLPHVKLSATSTADTQWTIRAIPRYHQSCVQPSLHNSLTFALTSSTELAWHYFHVAWKSWKNSP
jgi:tetratricopeptide (TPR) repeat protein